MKYDMMHVYVLKYSSHTHHCTDFDFTQPKDHEIQVEILCFPPKYVIPKSLKVGHWLRNFEMSTMLFDPQKVCI